MQPRRVPKEVTVLIGDVVNSRGFADRSRLQETLNAAFTALPVEAIQPPTMTIGDEFQAIYRDLPSLLAAELRIRASLAGKVKVRMGMGRGEVRRIEPGRGSLGQDGSAWWRAREALDWIGLTERSNSTAVWRSAIRTGDSQEPVLNGLLVLRSAVFEGVDATDGEILLSLLDGETISVIAKRLGLNKSSVSRRAISHGLRALVESQPL